MSSIIEKLSSLLHRSGDVAKWKPFEVLDSPISNKDVKYALVVLNSPCIDVNQLTLLWNKAKLKIVVDGAANELHDLLPELRPDLVTGDFDSILPNVLQFYKDKGSEAINTPDQDQTDFTKALIVLAERLRRDEIELDGIAVLEGSGGRVDHVLANINTLFLAKSITDLPVFLISSFSVTMLLDKGKHEITVDSPARGDHCGLIPIGAPCLLVTTTGLKWNLTNQPMQFGNLVSTSNAFDDSSIVSVKTDEPLLWTMSLKRKGTCQDI